MATPRQIQGLSRSAASGRVFARFVFKPEDMAGLVSDLSYASTQGVIRSVTQIHQIGKEVLNELKNNFPDSKKTRSAIAPSLRQPSLRLKEGWRVRYYDANIAARRVGANGASLLGFYIEHRQQGSERIRTVLNSLETGSTGYRLFPVRTSSLRFPGVNKRNPQHAMYADIPARAGVQYMRKTEQFAERILASRGSQMEKELVDLIEKGKTARLKELSRASFDRDATPNIQLAEETFSQTFERIGNPLQALKAIKSRVKRRRR